MKSETHTQTRRQRGRPSKGPRALVKGEVPLDVAARFEEAAERSRLTRTDLLAVILATTDYNALLADLANRRETLRAEYEALPIAG